MIRDLFGAVGRWWVRIQDVTEAQRLAEGLERNYAQLVRQWCEAVGARKQAEQKYADLLASANDDAKKTAATIASLRDTVERQNATILDLQDQRDTAIRKWRAADQALTLAEVAPRFDTGMREADQHRRNAIVLADRIAELQALLDTCGKEHS